MCIDCYFLSPRRATDDTWIPLYSQTCPVPLCAYRIPILSKDHREFLIFRALVLAYAQPPFVQPVYDFFIYGTEFIVICKKPEMTMIDFDVLESGIYQELIHMCIYSATMGMYALHKLKIVVGYFTLRHLLVMSDSDIVISVLNLFQYHCITCYKHDYDFLALINIILHYCLPASSYATYSKKLPPLIKKSACSLVNERRCKTTKFDYDAYALGLEGMKNEFLSEILFTFVINILQTRHWPAIINSPYLNVFCILPKQDKIHKHFRIMECSNTKAPQVYKELAHVVGSGSNDQLNVYFGNETTSPVAHTTYRDSTAQNFTQLSQNFTVEEGDSEPKNTDTDNRDSSKTETSIHSSTLLGDEEAKGVVRVEDVSLMDIPQTGQQEVLTVLQANSVNTRIDPTGIDAQEPASYINELIKRILSKLERTQIFDPESLINTLHTVSAENVLKLEKISSILKENKENIEQLSTVLPTPALLSVDRPTTFMAIKINQGPEIALGYGVVTQLIKGKARQISKSTAISENEVIRTITFITDNSLALQSGKERLVSIPEEMLVIHTGFHVFMEGGKKVRKRDTLKYHIENVPYAAPAAETCLEKIIRVKDPHKHSKADATKLGCSLTLQSENSDPKLIASAYDLFFEAFSTKKKIQASYEVMEKAILTLQKNPRAMTEEQKIEVIMLLRLFGINIQMHFYLRRGAEFPHNAIPVVIPFSFEDLTVHPAASNTAYLIGRIGFERWIAFMEAFQVCIRDGTLMPAISLYWCFFYFSLFSLTANVITTMHLLKFKESILYKGVADEAPTDLQKKKEEQMRRRGDVVPGSSSVVYPQGTFTGTHQPPVFADKTTKELRYNGIDPLLYSENVFITHFIIPQTEIPFDRCVNIMSKTVPIFFAYLHQSPELVSALSNLNGNLGESIIFRSNDQDVLKCGRALMRHLSMYIFEVVQPSLQSTDSFDVDKPFNTHALQIALPDNSMMTIHCPTPALISVLSSFISFVDASICTVNATARMKNLRIPAIKMPHVFNFRSTLDPTYLNTGEEAHAQAAFYMVCMSLNMLLVNTNPELGTLEHSIVLLSFTAVRNIFSPEAMLFLMTKMTNPIPFYNYVPLYSDLVEHQALITAYWTQSFEENMDNQETDYDQGNYSGVDIKREYRQRMILLYTQFQKPFCSCYPSIELCSNCATENELLRLECMNSISFFSDDCAFTLIIRLFHEAYLTLHKRLVPFLLTTKDRDVLYVLRIVISESRINPSRFLAILESASEIPRTDDGDVVGKDTGVLFGLSGIIAHICSSDAASPIEAEIKKHYQSHMQTNIGSPKKNVTMPVAMQGLSVIGGKAPAMPIPGRPNAPPQIPQVKMGDRGNERPDYGVNKDSVTQNDSYLTILLRCLLRYYTNINLFQASVIQAIISLLTPEVYDHLQQTHFFHPEALIYVTFSIMVRASKQAFLERSDQEVNKNNFGMLTLKPKKDPNQDSGSSDDSIHYIVGGGKNDEDEDVKELVSNILNVNIDEAANSLTIMSSCIQLLNTLLTIYYTNLKAKLTLLMDSQGYKLNQQKELFITKPPAEIMTILFNRVIPLDFIYTSLPAHVLENLEILAEAMPFSLYNAMWEMIPMSRNNTGTIDYLLRFMELLMQLHQLDYEALSLINNIQCEHFNVTRFAIDDLETRKLFRRRQYQTTTTGSVALASQVVKAIPSSFPQQDVDNTKTAPSTETDAETLQRLTTPSIPQASITQTETLTGSSTLHEEHDWKTSGEQHDVSSIDEANASSYSVRPIATEDSIPASLKLKHEDKAKKFQSTGALVTMNMLGSVDLNDALSNKGLKSAPNSPLTRAKAKDNATLLTFQIPHDKSEVVPTLFLLQAPGSMQLNAQQKAGSALNTTLTSKIVPLDTFLEKSLVIILHSTSTTANYALGIDGTYSLANLLCHIRIPHFIKVLYRILDSRYVKFVWRLRGVDFASQMFVWALMALRECCRPSINIARGDFSIQTPRDVLFPSFMQIKDMIIYGAIELKSEVRETTLMLLAEMSLCSEFWKEIGNVSFLQIVDRLCGNCFYFYDYFNEKMAQEREKEESLLSDNEFSRGLKLSELTDVSALLWNSLQHNCTNSDTAPLLRIYKQMLTYKDNVATEYGDSIACIIIRSLYPLKPMCKKHGYKIIVELGLLLGNCLVIDSNELRILIIDILHAALAGLYISVKAHLKTKLDDIVEPPPEMPSEQPTDSMLLRLSSASGNSRAQLNKIINCDNDQSAPDIFTGTESVMFDMGSFKQLIPAGTPLGSSVSMQSTMNMSASLTGSFNPAASLITRQAGARMPQLMGSLRSSSVMGLNFNQDRGRAPRHNTMGHINAGVLTAPTHLLSAAPAPAPDKQSLPADENRDEDEDDDTEPSSATAQNSMPANLPPTLPPRRDKNAEKGKGKGKGKDLKDQKDQQDLESLEESIMQDAHRGLIMTDELRQMITNIEKSLDSFLSNFIQIMRLTNVPSIAAACNILNFMYMLHLNSAIFTRYNLPVLLIECMRTKPLEIKKLIIDLVQRLILNNDVRKVFADINSVKYLRQAINMHNDIDFRNKVTEVIDTLKGKMDQAKKE